VQALGRHAHLHFVCRIGHAYSLTELLEAKENRIEERLWSAVVALEEMAMLLDDLIGAAGPLGLDTWTQVFHDRAENAREHARQIRSVIERERPVRVSQQEPSPEGDRPRAERG
jgi:two-component system chemotaxis response regulator CheB